MIPTNLCQPDCRYVYPHLERFEGGVFEPLRTRLTLQSLGFAKFDPRECFISVSRRYTRFGESKSERVPHDEKSIFSVARAFSSRGDDSVSPLTLPS